MDPINAALHRFGGGKFQEQFQALKNEVTADPRVKAFLKEHPELGQNELETGLNDLYQYKEQWQNCDNCPGLDKCPNLMQGYQPIVNVSRGKINLTYQSCPLKRRDDERKRHQSFMKSLYIPKDMLTVTFDDFEEDNKSRTEACVRALAFCSEAKPGEKGEGLYIHGPFGVGKTFLVSAIANEFADQEVETMLVYTPDFLRELKSGISDGSYQDKLDNVKRAKVLILDDIGAETMTPWVRDEVLGALLQFRMMEKLPTVFTSNFDLEELELHLASTQKGGAEKVDQLKAKRIMERIRHLTEEIPMQGSNKRLT
ncbi:primosomal protein DnaI [Alkalicoccus daliensis]|uniref:Replicative DNA helicase loader DnaI n=1 Tax=Alkalicoccus daliensis TaxID=745820 RepID=A0A1H0CEB1_9BACI|nr:primosomal protein DnaI [Alkalicoccus daliensis]SDN56219.1 replicative DNA helicase loader DnaI [Alkalicoccus daliensis]